MARSSDPRKQSVYFPNDLIEEIRIEAKRQGRSMSWLVQRAWQLAKPQLEHRPHTSAPSP